VWTNAGLGTAVLTAVAVDPHGGACTSDAVTVTIDVDTDGDGIPDVLDPDDDNDGMPDVWETDKGLDPLSAVGDDGADGDPDGDRFPNLSEYVADTDPRDGESYLWVGIEKTDNGIRLTFEARSGRQYRLLRAADLRLTNAWPALTNLGSGKGTAVTVVDREPAPCRYYRVGVSLP
jgi:hypothetical protein